MARDIANRTILLGNGVNLANPDNHFGSYDISHRFHDAIIEAKDVFNELVLLKHGATANDLYTLSGCADSDNIEQALGKVFQYLKNIIDDGKELRDNIERRVVDFLTQVGIKAIFVQNNRLVAAKIPAQLSDRIQSYKQFYTLNYHESWDPSSEDNPKDPHYLHGRLLFKKYSASLASLTKPAFLYSQARYQSMKRYHCLVDELADKYDVIPFQEHESLILLPDIMQKQKYSKGLYPSDDLLPACDIFPRDERILYDDLKKVHSLDVFGMSPYGDDSLLEIIASIADVCVFVHRPCSPDGIREVNEWRCRTPHAQILNGENFLD